MIIVKISGHKPRLSSRPNSNMEITPAPLPLLPLPSSPRLSGCTASMLLKGKHPPDHWHWQPQPARNKKYQVNDGDVAVLVDPPTCNSGHACRLACKVPHNALVWHALLLVRGMLWEDRKVGSSCGSWQCGLHEWEIRYVFCPACL